MGLYERQKDYEQGKMKVHILKGNFRPPSYREVTVKEMRKHYRSSTYD